MLVFCPLTTQGVGSLFNKLPPSTNGNGLRVRPNDLYVAPATFIKFKTSLLSTNSLSALSYHIVTSLKTGTPPYSSAFSELHTGTRQAPSQQTAAD